MLGWRIYAAGNNRTHLGLLVRCPTLLFDVNRICISWRIFIQVPGGKFHGNPSSGSRADTCGRTDGHGEANRRVSLLCERAKNPNSVIGLKNVIYCNRIHISKTTACVRNSTLPRRYNYKPPNAVSQGPQDVIYWDNRGRRHHTAHTAVHWTQQTHGTIRNIFSDTAHCVGFQPAGWRSSVQSRPLISQPYLVVSLIAQFLPRCFPAVVCCN
jgi:hypothetical protein